jgi:hypothetical protein
MFAQVNEVEIKNPFIALGSPCSHLGQSVPMREPFHRRLARATKTTDFIPARCVVFVHRGRLAAVC